MICYYKEMFVLGIFVSFLIWGVVTMFEDVIVRELTRFKRFIGVK